MTSYSQAITRRGGAWIVFLRVEGVGDATGQWTFCSSVPAYASGDAKWKPLLETLPRTLSERIDPLGGVRDAGSFTFDLADRSSVLTSLFRWDAPRLTRLTNTLGTAIAAFATVDLNPTALAAAGVVAPCILYIGTEAVLVGGISASGTGSQLTIGRGQNGTRATPHSPGEPVFQYLPRLEGRTVSLYLTPHDATSDGDALLLDQFTVTRVGYSEDWSAYRFECASRAFLLTRTLGAPAQGHYTIAEVVQGGRAITLLNTSPGAAPLGVWGSGSPEPRYFVIDGKEAILGQYYNGSNGHFSIAVKARARLGTSAGTWDQKAGTYQSGGPPVTAPLVADTSDGYGSFRFSPGPSASTSRSSGTWTQSDHWVDIILCLLLSSRTANDALALLNFSGTQPNYSALEVGWGAGIPVSQIDVTSFLAIKDRTPDWRFPAFRLEAPGKASDIITKEFLKPTGAMICTRSGVLTLILPRLPVTGRAPAASLDSSSALRKKGKNELYQPQVQGAFDPSLAYRAVKLQIRGPYGDPVTTLITAGDLNSQVVQHAAGTDGEQVLTLEINSIRANASGTQSIIEALAIRKLIRLWNPPRRIQASGNLGTYGVSLGALAGLTFALAPDHSAGSRGITNRQHLVVGRTFSLDPKAADPGYQFELLDYGSSSAAPIGLVAPAGFITGVSANTATISANRYTDSAATGDYPTSDASAFAVGMRLKLQNANGTDATGAGVYQTITGISGNNVTLDGNFGGLLATNLVLTLVDWDYARAADQGLYVAEADATTGKVGSSASGPWAYGEL